MSTPHPYATWRKREEDGVNMRDRRRAAQQHLAEHAERLAHMENDERDRQELMHLARTTGPYHSFGIEGLGDQSVCHLCSAVVQGRDVHTAWHASMGQEMPQ